jgi:glycosyltransferase involved in cell wall biosynthesis
MTIHILHLRSSGGFYGAESVILNLSLSIRAYGIESHICCINNQKNPHTELVDRAREQGLEAFAILCRGLFDRQTVKSIRDLIVQKNIDILHCHDYKADILGVLACRGLNIKRIATNHGWTQVGFKLRFYEFIDGLFLNEFHKVIAVSDKIADETRIFLWNKKKVEVIYNGIDTDIFSRKNDANIKNLKITLGFNDNDLLIGSIGRLSKEKDQATLIFTFASILKKKKEYASKLRLFFVGDGADKNKLMALVEELGVSKNIIFLGARSNIMDFYSVMDLFVLSSRREGLPMVLLEAMAMGIPVIATNVGAVSTLIQNEKTGILVEPKDTEGLANAMMTLLQDRQKAEALAAGANTLVKEKFSSTIMARQYNEIYKSLLK